MSIFDSFVTQAAGPLVGRTALILGNDTALRAQEADLLRQIGAARVVEAADPEIALANLAGVDIVYADAVAGGIDLLKAIRANPATARLCVVVVTSDTGNAKIAIEGKRTGASNLMARPYLIETLADKTFAALQRAAGT